MNVKILTRYVLSLALSFLIQTSTLAQQPETPELLVQAGHGAGVTSVAYSADGKTLATASRDGTVRLWDVATGRELRVLAGRNAGEVNAVALSMDGQFVASAGGGDYSIHLWEVATGRLVQTLAGHTLTVNALSFSRQRRLLASGSRDGTVRLWDARTGELLGTINDSGDSSRGRRSGAADGAINSVALSADGRFVAGGGAARTINLWDTMTGRLVQTFDGHGGGVRSVAFNADGRVLVSGGDDRAVKLWEVATGKKLRTLVGHRESVAAVAVSPDGLTIASAGDDRIVKLWAGKEPRSLAGHAGAVTSVAFSPDGKRLASGGSDANAKLWDVAAGREERALTGHARAALAAVVSADGRWLASGGGERDKAGMIRLWDLRAAGEFRTLDGHTDFVVSVAFSPDGALLASGSADRRIKLWDVQTGAMRHTLDGHADAVTTVAFSPDARWLASGSRDQTIRLWEAATGRGVRTLARLPGPALAVVFSPDGRTLAASSANGGSAIKLWDVATGRELRAFDNRGSAPSGNLAFSLDGQLLAAGDQNGTVNLWSAATNQLARTLNVPSSASRKITALAFSRDGRTLATAAGDGAINLWNVVDAAGKNVRTLTGHTAGPFALSFPADDQTLISSGPDATTRLWDVRNGAELARLIAVDDKDWLVATPDGLFDGSPAAWNHVLWRYVGNTFNVAPIEWFFNEFFAPGLLGEIVAGRRPVARRELAAQDRRQPAITISPEVGTIVATDKTATVGARTLKLRIEVRDAAPDAEHPTTGTGARDLRLFRNGSLVKVWRGDVLKGQDFVTLEALVPIVAGANTFTAYAFNQDNVKSKTVTLPVAGAERLRRKGVAHVLVVGINAYANRQYNLRYAVADATAFAAEIKSQQSKLGAYGRVEVAQLLDAQATKANILHALANLRATAQPEDLVVVYFAGHGTAQQNQFYLLPHDLGYTGERGRIDQAGVRQILAHGISDRELEQELEGLDAGQLVLVIDACNSGQAIEAEEKRRGPMNAKGLAQLAYEKGMYVLTASESFQAALEVAQVGHGLLTYALVNEGLQAAAADAGPKDGQILIREWLDYATARVPEMQIDKMKEARGLGLNLSFRDDERGLPIERRSGQRPRVFYRRELEAQPLIIAKP